MPVCARIRGLDLIASDGEVSFADRSDRGKKVSSRMLVPLSALSCFYSDSVHEVPPINSEIEQRDMELTSVKARRRSRI